MLNKKEKAVFFAILEFLDQKKTCLVTLDQLLEKIDEKFKLNSESLETILNELSIDGYIDYVVSVSKDKTYYCITLQKKGTGFYREEQQNKRSIINRVFITVALAILSFTVTLILKSIFS